MSAPSTKFEQTDSLYVYDAELIRRMGWGERRGRDYLRRLDRGIQGVRKYPQKDPFFGGRRFWPAVMQWHLDYHHVRTGVAATVAPLPMWKENFDEPASEASDSKHARPDLATA